MLWLEIRASKLQISVVESSSDRSSAEYMDSFSAIEKHLAVTVFENFSLQNKNCLSKTYRT